MPKQVKKTSSKADRTAMAVRIRRLLSEGMSRTEVADELGIRYQWVRNVEITPLTSVAA